jgi:hypothetical protein
MKKLLTLLAVLGLLFTAAVAAELPFKMGTWGNLVFTAIIDEEGIDLTQTGASYGSYMVTFSQTFGSTVTVNFSFNGSGLSLNTADFWLKLETPLFDAEYNPTAIIADDYIFYVSPSNAGYTEEDRKTIPNYTVTPKLGIEGLGLTFYYADLVSETDLDDATTTTGNFFDDAIGVKVSVTNLDLVDATLFGAFYDTDIDSSTSTYAYGLHLNLTGKDVLDGLVVDLAYTSDNATSNYIVYAEYSKEFDFDVVKLTVTPYLNYSEGAAKFYDNNTKQSYEGWNSDTVDWGQKYLGATVLAEANPVDFLTVYAGVKPTIYLDGSNNYELPVRAGALLDYEGFKLFGNIRLDAHKSTDNFWYNVGAAYKYGELLAGVLFGTYRDNDYDFFTTQTLLDTNQDGNTTLDEPTFFGFINYRLAF